MTKVWGHRGAYDYAPENTISGFSKAINMGADGVELDIQLTRDGEVVVIHDETIERVSNGIGFVKDYNLVELKRINFNKRGLIMPLFMEIPTLAEVFETLATTAIEINIELKTGIVFYEGIEEKAIRLAIKHKILERIIWSSFNHYSVMRVKQLEPSARIALLCGSGILLTSEQCEKTGAEALHPFIKQLNYPGLVDDCHKRGIKVNTWTVNKAEEIQCALRYGVDAVITNRIDAVIDARRMYDN